MIGSRETLANEGETLFIAEMATIDSAISFTCRRGGLRHADAEDFASYVKVRLIESDYSILRKYEGRCKFAGFISIVVQRMLLDYRIHLWGKWHASSKAKRLGPAAVALESLLRRDGLTIDEAWTSLLAKDFSMTREEVEMLAAQIPARAPRSRLVDLDAVTEQDLSIDEGEAKGPSPFARDRTALSRCLASLIRGAIEKLPDSERLLFRLHFQAQMSVADIARMLHVRQKPLYRRVDNLIMTFRRHMEEAGIRAEDAASLIGDPVSDLDFGFDSENADPPPSAESESEHENEEAR